MKFPTYHFDENLREVPTDAAEFTTYIQSIEKELAQKINFAQEAELLGEAAVALRILNQLEAAEEKIQRSLQLIHTHRLGLRSEIQQKIRHAHICQWQKDFKKSNHLFTEIIHTCRTKPEAKNYLDFALQHQGKNLFEQNQYKEAITCFEEALNLREFRNAPADQMQATTQALKTTKKRIKNET